MLLGTLVKECSDLKESKVGPREKGMKEWKEWEVEKDRSVDMVSKSNQLISFFGHILGVHMLNKYINLVLLDNRIDTPRYHPRVINNNNISINQLTS